jgi:hypothetical protein
MYRQKTKVDKESITFKPNEPALTIQPDDQAWLANGEVKYNNTVILKPKKELELMQNS